MFRVQERYTGPAGEIRYSEAPPQARFVNRTRRVALKYVAQGLELYQYRQQEIAVKAGHWMLLPSDESFEAQIPQQSQQTVGLCIDLSLDTRLEMDLNALGTSFWSAWALPPLPYSRVHEQLMAGIQNPSPPSSGYWEDVLIPQICCELGKHMQNLGDFKERLQGQAKKTSTQRHLMEKLWLAQSYLQQHFRRSIRQQELARHVQLSPDHLRYCFKRVFSLSPGEMQKKLRMEEAKRMLKEKNQSLSDIAFQLGYTDLAAFSRQFKQYYQQSPSEVRKQDRG